MLQGWIIARLEEKSELENLGISLGDYNEREGCFEKCLVSETALKKLDPLWHKFYWGLDKLS
jgi:hypothetical protein